MIAVAKVTRYVQYVIIVPIAMLDTILLAQVSGKLENFPISNLVSVKYYLTWIFILCTPFHHQKNPGFQNPHLSDEALVTTQMKAID